MASEVTAIELFHADGKSSGVFYCSTCRSVHTSEHAAQRCHGVTHCDKCGIELGERQPYYRTTCQTCDNAAWREKRAKEEFERYQKAAKVSSADWKGEQVYFGDQYYETVEEAIDQCDDPPEYVWAAKNTGLRKATAEDVYERVLEEAWEDAEVSDLNGVDELEAAVKAFNEANESIVCWMVDYSTAIVLDAEILAEWKSEQPAGTAGEEA